MLTHLIGSYLYPVLTLLYLIAYFRVIGSAHDTKVRALDMGATDYTVKPFNALKFIARAQSALHHTFMGAETPVMVDREALCCPEFR